MEARDARAMSKNGYTLTKTSYKHLRFLEVSLLRYRCGHMLLMREPIVRKTSQRGIGHVNITLPASKNCSSTVPTTRKTKIWKRELEHENK